MADKKITELPFITDVTASVGTAPANTTVIPVVLYGTTNQITADNLKDNFIREVRATVAGVQTYTSSLKGAVTVRGNGIEVAGNLEIGGNVSVKGTLHTQYETSSIIYSSGSTKFGNSFDDLHEFTGSIYFTGSHTINGEDYTYYSSSNSAVFTDFSSSNSSAITSFSSSNSTLYTNFSSSNSTLFTNFSSSNSSYNTTFSSSNASYITALSSSNSTYNTTFSSSNASYVTALSSSNSSYNTNLSSSNSTLFTNFSSSNSTTFTNDSSSASTLFTNFSSSNSSYNTTFSSSNSTTFTNFSSSNSTTFTNYSSSTANSIAGLSSGVSGELARVYQTTSSLNIFTGSQDSRNFVISQFTSSTNNSIVGVSAFTSSQLAVNLGNAIFTSSARIELNSIEGYTASLKNAAIVSSSTQVQNYDVFALNSNLYTSTGSLIGITNGLMALTASMKAQAIVSSSQQITNYYKFAETASANTFYGNQKVKGNLDIDNKVSITGSLIVSSSANQLWATPDFELYNGLGTVNFRLTPNTGNQLQIQAYGTKAEILQANEPLRLLSPTLQFVKYDDTPTKVEVTGSLRVNGPLRGNIISGGLDVNGGITGSVRGNLDGVAAYASTVAVANTGTTTDTTLFPIFSLSPVLASYTNLYSHASSSFFYNGVTRRLHMEGFVVSGSNNIAEISGSLIITGSSTITGSFLVSGSTTQIGNNTLTGNTILSGSINISGSTTFEGTHLLTGNNTIIGNTQMSGSINVSGSSNFHNSVFIVTGSSFFTGSHTINGNSTFSGSINIASGSSYYRAGNKLFNYGQWGSLETQSGSADTAYAIKLGTKFDGSEGVSVANNGSGFPTRLTVENTGLYNIQFSLQLHTTANESVDFSVWFAMTGSNIANSNTDFSIEKVSGGGFQVAALNFLTPIVANDYVELYWSKTTANGELQYKGTQSTPTRPATPSVIVTITQVA